MKLGEGIWQKKDTGEVDEYGNEPLEYSKIQKS